MRSSGELRYNGPARSWRSSKVVEIRINSFTAQSGSAVSAILFLDRAEKRLSGNCRPLQRLLHQPLERRLQIGPLFGFCGIELEKEIKKLSEGRVSGH